jgi:hypothetical protein
MGSRLLLFASVAIACGAAFATATPASVPRTSLTIAIQRDGAKPGSVARFTLKCNPGRGTLPHPAQACGALVRLDKPFAPTPRGVACTDIYGGPQRALVTGIYQGRKVWARFRRTNGCEIARWDRLRFLFPVPTGVR